MAFHQEISRDPDIPYTVDCFDKIRDAVSERAIVLSNAAEDNGASAVSFCNDFAAPLSSKYNEYGFEMIQTTFTIFYLIS